ncbi:hypothetical protein SVIOM342S_07778 [Streptomyces violaceorubidus]
MKALADKHPLYPGLNEVDTHAFDVGAPHPPQAVRRPARSTPLCTALPRIVHHEQPPCATAGVAVRGVPVAISVFDLFSIGIGPSSSHTVGPMRAARMFARRLRNEELLDSVASVRAELYGSLGATGHGHGTPKAVLLGLEGDSPRTVDVETADDRVETIKSAGRISLLGEHEIAFSYDDDMVLHRRKALPYHANGMTLWAYDAEGAEVLTKTYYSVGGGFVVDEDAVGADRIVLDDTVLKYPFRTGDELLRLARETGLSISALMLENERAWRDEDEIREGLLEIWRVMQACVERGMTREGILPGGLKVRRRAANTARKLRSEGDPLALSMEWITLYAMAVNEENAAGGRVVTAPTNGAAGIIPAVLHYYVNFVPGADEDGVVRFLLAAPAPIALLFKENASIAGPRSAAEEDRPRAASVASEPRPPGGAATAPRPSDRAPPRPADGHRWLEMPQVGADQYGDAVEGHVACGRCGRGSPGRGSPRSRAVLACWASRQKLGEPVRSAACAVEWRLVDEPPTALLQARERKPLEMVIGTSPRAGAAWPPASTWSSARSTWRWRRRPRRPTSPRCTCSAPRS